MKPRRDDVPRARPAQNCRSVLAERRTIGHDAHSVEGEPQIYRSLFVVWAACFLSAVATVVGAVWTIGVALSDYPALALFGIPFLVLAVWSWYANLVLMSFEVRLWPDGRLTFRSVLRSKATTVAGIKEIRRMWNGRVLVVQFDRASTHLPNVETTRDFALRTRDANGNALIQV